MDTAKLDNSYVDFRRLLGEGLGADQHSKHNWINAIVGPSVSNSVFQNAGN